MKSISFLAKLLKRLNQKLTRKPALFSLLAILCCARMFAQNSANIIVQPTPISTSSGQNFVVNVRVDFTTPPATSSVDAVEVHLTFDKTKLQVASITKPALGSLPVEAIPLQSITTIN